MPDVRSGALAAALLCAAGCSFEISGLSIGDVGSTELDAGVPTPDLAEPPTSGPDLLAPPDLAPLPPELTGSGVASATSANLTVLGPTDWIHFGTTSASDIDRKLVANSVISGFSELKNGKVTQYINNVVSFRWSDGKPIADEPGTTTGVYIAGVDDGFAVSVPADTTEHTVVIFVGGYLTAATLSAHLSDKSAPDFSSSNFSNMVDVYNATFTLKYRAASANQTLLIAWKQTSGAGNVTLQAVALN